MCTCSKHVLYVRIKLISNFISIIICPNILRPLLQLVSFISQTNTRFQLFSTYFWGEKSSVWDIQYKAEKICVQFSVLTYLALKLVPHLFSNVKNFSGQRKLQVIIQNKHQNTCRLSASIIHITSTRRGFPGVNIVFILILRQDIHNEHINHLIVHSEEAPRYLLQQPWKLFWEHILTLRILEANMSQ